VLWADESHCTRWDGQKTKLSPTAEMLKSMPLVQLPAVNCRQLCWIGFAKKKKIAMSLRNFLFILIPRLLPNLKQK